MAAPQLIRVENTQSRLRDFPADKANKIPALRLLPGGNNVAASVVQTLQAGASGKRGLNAGWADAVTRGHLKVHSAEDSKVLCKQKEGPAAPASLIDRNTKAAIQIVKVTSDVEVLEMWAKKEGNRPKVAAEIALRLADLGA